MSYGTRGGSNYSGRNRRGSGSHRFSGKSVAEIQNERSMKAKLMDASRKAPIAKSIEEWAEKPNRLDLPDVDAPKEPLPATIAQEVKADIKDEKKAGPDYEALSAKLDKAGLVEEAQKVEAIAAQEGQHKEVLKDIVERKPDVIATKIEPPKGSVEGATATYNKATGWMALSFSDIPPVEVRQEMKSSGFRWNPVRKQWVGKWYPSREGLAKKIAGSVVEVNIETNWAAKAEHAAAMASAHEGKAEELHSTAEKMGDRIPFGQPILVDHYSAKSDMNFRNRMNAKYEKSFEEHDVAEKYRDKAERYGQKATGEKPDVIYRRIQKLEAEERKMKRRLNDPDYTKNESTRAHFQKWLDHYQSRLSIEREKYKASGGIAVDKIQFQPGDRIYTKWGVGTIASISKKTARVKLDPDPRTGRSVGIYSNQRGESLLSVDDLKEKLSADQLQRYEAAIQGIKSRQ